MQLNNLNSNLSYKVPVVILNGFLGSGKTTLFINLLAQSKKKNVPVCAIVNDMSELDVDGELIDDIRKSVNSGLALGNDYFKDQIESLYNRRVTKGQSGRPKPLSDPR